MLFTEGKFRHSSHIKLGIFTPCSMRIRNKEVKYKACIDGEYRKLSECIQTTH